MLWLTTLRAIANHSGFYIDPLGNVWSHWYRGCHGKTRAVPRILPPTRTTHGYMVVNLRGKTRLVHQLVAKEFHGLAPGNIDHINRNRADNRASNLRECSRSENNRNVTRSGKTSKYLGVYLESRTTRFVSHIMADGKKFSRAFRSELAAALFRDFMACQYHGRFASLNFPGEKNSLYLLVELYSRIHA